MALAVSALNTISVLDILLDLCKRIYEFYLEVVDIYQEDPSDLDHVYYDGVYYLNTNHY